MNGTFQNFLSFYLFFFLTALTCYSADLKFADVQNKQANKKNTATNPNKTNANKPTKKTGPRSKASLMYKLVLRSSNIMTGLLQHFYSSQPSNVHVRKKKTS